MGKHGTDRIVIALALILMMIVGGAYYFDTWMWGGHRARGETIGVITSQDGDVRLKFQDDLKWSRAALGQKLAYDDAIYAGAGSRANLDVGQSKMTVTENSLVVLRRDQNVSFLNLNYGHIFGTIARNEKIVIDTGDGKRVELEATKDTRITVRRNTKGRTQLDVENGEAKINVDGKRSVITKSERLVFEREPAAPARRLALRALKPRATDVVYSREPTRLGFEWAWENGRGATADENYVLEFATTPDFKSLHATKTVPAALTSSMGLSQTLNLLYRVRGPRGELSNVERVRFVRMGDALIVNPVADATFESGDVDAPVDFTFEKPAEARVKYQVARAPDFVDPVLERQVNERGREKLGPGDYFVRAQSDYAGHGAGRWTEPRAFHVTRALRPLARARGTPSPFALIPNRAYPAELYAAAPAKVRRYLQSQGFLRRFFPFERNEYDAVTVNVDGDAHPYVSATPAWPREKLGPGTYAYTYQTQKQGFAPSAPSSPRRLDVALEPPKPLGEVKYGPRSGDNMTPAEWGFTPLLFARSYDVEIAPTPTFRNAVELHTKEARVSTRIGDGPYFWRARARDERGRLISAYSAPVANRPAPAPPPYLSQRAPAQAEITSKIERIVEKSELHNGWYAWLGTGENYIKYDQTVQGLGAASSQQIRPGSQYFEGGYTSLSGLGGVMSYQGVPGNIELDNANVGDSRYRWTSFTVDAVMRKLSAWRPGGEPVIYGLRAGLGLQRAPFLFIDEKQAVTRRMNDITNAGLGVLAEWSQRRWRYYSMLRYQMPLSTRADGSSSFAISSNLTFNGSLGTSYNVTDRLKLGAFLYGQFQKFDFAYETPAVTNSGEQTLIFSSLDLRLGYDF